MTGRSTWYRRPASKHDVANAALADVIKDINVDSRRTYDARRVHAELQNGFELRVERGIA